MSRPIAFLASIVSLLAADAGRAAPIAVSAQLEVVIPMPGEPLIRAVATGTGVIDLSGGVYTTPAALVTMAGPITIPLSSTTAVQFVVLSGLSNFAGSFAPGAASASEICLVPSSQEACVSGGGLGGIMAITGAAFFHVLPHVVVVPVPFYEGRIGQGGSAATPPYTADGAPWTTGAAFVHGPGSHVTRLSGHVDDASLSLVSTAFVLALGNQFPVMARFTLTPLVPEPTGLALVFTGTAGLIALALRGR